MTRRPVGVEQTKISKMSRNYLTNFSFDVPALRLWLHFRWRVLIYFSFVLFKRLRFKRLNILSYIYIICRPGGPYWEKLCQRSWVRPEAAGRGPCSRPRAQFFSIRTDQGRQIIFLFFSCCFSKVKRVLLFSESNVLQARVKWTMKRSRLWHQSSKIRFFTLLKLRNHRKQYN